MDGICKFFVNPSLRVQNRSNCLDILHNVYFIYFERPLKFSDFSNQNWHSRRLIDFEAKGHDMQIVVTRLSLWDFVHRDGRVSRQFCHANLQMLDCIVSLPSSAYEIKYIDTYYMNEFPPVRIRTLPPAVVVSQRPSRLYTQRKYDLFSSLEAYTRARAKRISEATLYFLCIYWNFLKVTYALSQPGK